MTARVPAVEPTFANEAERLVWETLRDQLPGDAILVSGLRIVDETLDHEADIIVLLPDAGIVVVEVKGGSVWYGARDRDARDRRAAAGGSRATGSGGSIRSTRRCG